MELTSVTSISETPIRVVELPSPMKEYGQSICSRKPMFENFILDLSLLK